MAIWVEGFQVLEYILCDFCLKNEQIQRIFLNFDNKMNNGEPSASPSQTA